MLKLRSKRHAAQAARAITRLMQIEASIVALGDDDILDLADIFKDAAHTPLGEIATAEMAKRKLSL